MFVCGRSVYSAHTSYVVDYVDVVVAKYTYTHPNDMIPFSKCMFMAKHTHTLPMYVHTRAISDYSISSNEEKRKYVPTTALHTINFRKINL